jgi:hypothetical protein
MAFYWLLLGALSVWRITHFLRYEDGPWQLAVHLRRRAGAGIWGELLDCFYCLSVWMAAPAACMLGSSWSERLWLCPALSALAILIQRFHEGHTAPPASYTEDRSQE